LFFQKLRKKRERVEARRSISRKGKSHVNYSYGEKIYKRRGNYWWSKV
jgi:hypothetical protein